jgi:DNA-binding transcriptional MerR regulator
MALRVGQVAKAAGMAAKTIRYYEQVGVLPPPSRTAAGYRQYGEQAVQQLMFIRRARALGLSLHHLKTLTRHWTAGLAQRCIRACAKPSAHTCRPCNGRSVSSGCSSDSSNTCWADFRGHRGYVVSGAAAASSWRSFRGAPQRAAAIRDRTLRRP